MTTRNLQALFEPAGHRLDRRQQPAGQRVLAREMISRTRVSALLGAYRDRPAGDAEGVAEGRSAEFALLVRSDRQKRGIGGALLSRLLGYAQARGLQQVWGDVLGENQRMLALARDLGFRTRPAGDLALVQVVKDLA